MNKIRKAIITVTMVLTLLAPSAVIVVDDVAAAVTPMDVRGPGPKK